MMQRIVGIRTEAVSASPNRMSTPLQSFSAKGWLVESITMFGR